MELHSNKNNEYIYKAYNVSSHTESKAMTVTDGQHHWNRDELREKERFKKLYQWLGKALCGELLANSVKNRGR